MGNIEASDDEAFSRRALAELEDGSASAIHSDEASPVRSVTPWEGTQLMKAISIAGFESAEAPDSAKVLFADIIFLNRRN